MIKNLKGWEMSKKLKNANVLGEILQVQRLDV